MTTEITPQNLISQAFDLVKSIEKSFIQLGATLYQIRKENAWQGSYESWEDFLGATRLSPSVASVLVKVHDKYCITGGAEPASLQGCGYSNLYEAIPLLETEDVDVVIAKARMLTRAEIKQEVREEKHPECAHLNHIVICADCKKRIDFIVPKYQP